MDLCIFRDKTSELYVCRVGRNQWAVVLSIADEGSAPLTSRRQSSIVIIVVSLWHSSSLNRRFSPNKTIGSQIIHVSAYLMKTLSQCFFFEDWNWTINLPGRRTLLLSQTLSSLNTDDGARNETNEGNNQEASREAAMMSWRTNELALLFGEGGTCTCTPHQQSPCLGGQMLWQ